jgi:hypothetical protein
MRSLTRPEKSVYTVEIHVHKVFMIDVEAASHDGAGEIALEYLSDADEISSEVIEVNAQEATT